MYFRSNSLATQMRAVVYALLMISGFAISGRGQTTVLSFTSSPQTFVTRGQSVTITPTNGYRITAVYDGTLRFDCQNTNDVDTYWIIDFQAPLKGLLTPGLYFGAERTGFQPSGSPGLDFFGEGRDNNFLIGSFKVLEATYDTNTNIISFAADFLQYDNGYPFEWSQGSVRFNSTVPYPQPFLISTNSGTNLVLSWPVSADGFNLYGTTNLTVPNWLPVSNYMTNDDGTVSVISPMDAGCKFFRLAK